MGSHWQAVIINLPEMEQLFKIFMKYGSLDDSLRDYISSVLKVSNLERNQKIVEEGTTSKIIGFIEKGIIRSYRKKRGGEKTCWLMTGGDIFVSLKSFMLQEPAKETIQALAPTIIHTITFDQYKYIIDHWISFHKIRAEILQNYYILSEQREEMRLQEAYDKFLFLKKHQPSLVDTVKDKYLASYLGISAGTYSKAKNRYKKKNLSRR